MLELVILKDTEGVSEARGYTGPLPFDVIRENKKSLCALILLLCI